MTEVPWTRRDRDPDRDASAAQMMPSPQSHEVSDPSQSIRVERLSMECLSGVRGDGITYGLTARLWRQLSGNPVGVNSFVEAMASHT